MRRTYNEWADTVNNLPYDLVLVDMLSDWQADGIRLTKCINNLEARIAELEAEVAALNGVIDRTVNAWESRCIEQYAENERLHDCYLYHETILPNGHLGVNVLEVCEGLQKADAEIAKLNGWVDELIKAGEGASWMKPAWFNAWDTLVIRINKERETSNELQSDAVVDSKECEDNSRAYDENHPAHKALVRAWKQKEREGNGN